MNTLRRFQSWIILAAFFTFFSRGFGQGALVPAPVPAMDKIDAGALQGAVRAAMACGAEYLMSAEETNQCGFLFAPVSYSNIVSYSDTKEVESRYKLLIQTNRQVTSRHARMKPVFESYETFEVGTGASGVDARNLRKVTKQRVIGQKPDGFLMVTQILYDASRPLASNQTVIGTVTITQTLADVNGPFAVKRQVPINPVWARQVYWNDGLLGLNGMGMYVLLKCGYYEKNNMLQSVARNISSHIEYYGMPDLTWDVAWLAAAFANIPDPKFNATRDRLVNRLLDGQIVEGAARGMWGPVCIRGETLGAMLAYEQTLTKAFAKAKDELAKRPDYKLRQTMVNESEETLKSFQKSYLMVAQQGLRFEQVTNTFVTGSPDERIIQLGLPYYIYNQAVADMESTALALFAIREAAKNKALPAKTVMPVGARKTKLLEGEMPQAILARTAAALAAMQKQDGTWDEANKFQPISVFIPFGMPALKPEEVLVLESPQTLLSTVQGLSALVDLGYVVGYDRLMGKYRANVDAGYKAVVEKLEAFLGNPAAKEGVGRLVPPYDLSGKAPVLMQPGVFPEGRRDLWSRMAYHLVLLQKDDGSWPGVNGVFTSSGLLAQYDAQTRKDHELQQARLPEEKRVPYNRTQARAVLYRGMRPMPGGYLATCQSMLHLLAGVREPVVGFFDEKADAAMPPVLKAACNGLGRETGVSVTPLRVTPRSEAGLVIRLPVVYLDGAALPEMPQTKALLAAYCQGTGFLVIEKPVNANPDFETKWAAIINGKAGNVPDNIEFMKNLAGKAAMRGLFGGNGQLTGVFMPQVKDAAGMVTVDARVVTVVAAILKQHAPSAYFEGEYPVKVNGDPDSPFVTRIVMREQLSLASRAAPQALPDRAAGTPVTTVPTASPPPAAVVKPGPGEEPVETTDTGVPVPRTQSRGGTKTDEVW